MNTKGRKLILIKQRTYDALQGVKNEENNTFDSVINRLLLVNAATPLGAIEV